MQSTTVAVQGKGSNPKQVGPWVELLRPRTLLAYPS